MDREMLHLTLLGIKGRKKSSILLGLVCMLSFSFAIVTLSITISLEKTNAEYRYDLYGTWKAAILDTAKQDFKGLKETEAISKVGGLKICGSILDGGGGRITKIGSMDETFQEIGRISLLAGTWPEHENEIVMEANLLSFLGYDYELGQEINLTILQREDSCVEKKFILTGILKEYTNLWSLEGNQTAGVLVHESAVAGIAKRVSWQYFFTSQSEMERLAVSLQRSYEEEQTIITNGGAYGASAKEEQHYFYLCLILSVTVVAVLAAYSIQLKQQARFIALFRSIGGTKRQLLQITFYETLCITMVSAALALGLGFVAIWGLLHALIKVSVSQFFVVIPAKEYFWVFALWFGAIFLIRLFVLQDALRMPLTGRIAMVQKKERRRRKGRDYLLVLLGTATCTSVLFCYLQSFQYFYIEDTWGQISSYDINGDRKNNIPPEGVAQLSSLPGVEKVLAYHTLGGSLEFPDMEQCEAVQAVVSYLPDTVAKLPEEKEFPKGMGVYMYGIREDNWDMLFSLSKGKIDRQAFQEGRQVIVHIPDSLNQYISTQNKGTYGVELGTEVTLSSYGYGEETGAVIASWEEAQRLNQATVEVAGIITDSMEKEAQLSPFGTHYYSVFCSDTLMQRLLESERSGILVSPSYQTGETYGYSHIKVYTNQEAAYASTDYRAASIAFQYGADFNNSREQNAAYRQDATQALAMLEISTTGIFLISLLIQWNAYVLNGKAKRRGWGILQAIGMSESKMKWVLLKKSLLGAVKAMVFAHVAYAIYMLVKNGIRYAQYQGNVWHRMRMEVLDYLAEGWNPAIHIVLCIGCIGVLFLVSYLSQQNETRGGVMEKINERGG